MQDIFTTLLDPLTLIKTLGLLGVFAVVFAESGLFFGFFLPGDSLLFTAGLLASQGFLPLGWLMLGSAFFAISGDSVGYIFGKKVGPAIFTKEDSSFFHKKHIERSQKFYEKYGAKAIVLARFIPIVRTFAPILAGVGNMHYRRFITYNITGGLLWSLGMTGIGYFLGNTVPHIDRYILPIIIGMILLSFVPIIKEYFAARSSEGQQG